MTTREESIAWLTTQRTQRRAWVKATGNLQRQIKAIQRIAAKYPDDIDSELTAATIAPLEIAMAAIQPSRKQLEKNMTEQAKNLGVNDFVDSITGFGYFGLALIIAETGDLANYDSHSKLWKRLGLAVINGESQRRKPGAAALEQGYSPIRRSMMFTIGDSLIKKQNRYRDMYLERKEYEKERNSEMTKMHAHRRAQRYAEKRLLKDLWKRWNNA